MKDGIILSQNRKEAKQAFWISPSNKIYLVITTHIAYILDNPELFNFTREWLLSIYQKYNEKIGFEGKARREIMIQAINAGWIRVRFKPKEGIWRIECKDIVSQYNIIKVFVLEGVKKGWINDNDKVLYSDFEDCEHKGVRAMVNN